MKVWILFGRNGQTPRVAYDNVAEILDYLANGRPFDWQNIEQDWVNNDTVFLTLPEGDGYHERMFTARSVDYFRS